VPGLYFLSLRSKPLIDHSAWIDLPALMQRARRASRPRLSHLLDDIVAMKTKKIFGILAAITFVVLLCKIFLPEWIVSGFHIG
jgi:hypothetical protein